MTITLLVTDSEAAALQKRVEQVNKTRLTTHTVDSWLQGRLNDIVKNQISMVDNSRDSVKNPGA